jgi:hypothetical protein
LCELCDLSENGVESCSILVPIFVRKMVRAQSATKQGAAFETAPPTTTTVAGERRSGVGRRGRQSGPENNKRAEGTIPQGLSLLREGR